MNDSFGHVVGDALLRQMAGRLPGALRATDMLARLGGDEFLVVLPNTSSEAARQLARGLIQALAQPFELDQQPLKIGVSIGISLYPDDARDEGELLQHADAAMYEAKRKGRNAFECFDVVLEEEVRTRLRLRHDLQRALQNEEFELHYQPLVAMKSGRIVGAEALVC